MKRLTGILLLLLAIAFLPACEGGKVVIPPQFAVGAITTACGPGNSISPCMATDPPRTPGDQTTAVTLSATASNGATTAGLTWSATCSDGTSPCGSFSSMTTASGAPTVWTPPCILGCGAVAQTSFAPRASHGRVSAPQTGATAITATITATSSSASSSINITVNAFATFTPPAGSNLPTANFGVAYPPPPGNGMGVDFHQFFTGGTAPFTWGVDSSSTGTLPAGMTLDPNTGILSGTPTPPVTARRMGHAGKMAGRASRSLLPTQAAAPSCSTITFECTDVFGFKHTFTLDLCVTDPLAISPFTLPNGSVGAAYGPVQINSTGGIGPNTWSWAPAPGSTAPPGLMIDPPSGVVSGTPTMAGTFMVIISVTDSEVPMHTVMSATQSITIVQGLGFSTTSLPNATVGTPYNTTVMAVGGTPPYHFTGTGFPPSGDLSISDPGVISGTPTAADVGTFNVNIMVTDSTTPTPLTAMMTFPLVINPAVACTPAQNTLCGNFGIFIYGFNAAGPFTLAAAITTDGVNVNGGVLDFNSFDHNFLNQSIAASPASSFTFDANTFGTITLQTPSITFVATTTLNLAGNAGSIILFNDNTGTGMRGSGFIQAQNNTVFNKSAINGTYARGDFGANLGFTTGGRTGRVAEVGVMSSTGMCDFDSPSLGATPSLTINNGGATTAPLAFTGSCLVGGNSTIDPVFGRGTAALTITSGSPFSSATQNFSFYILDADSTGTLVDKMVFMATDPVGTNLPLLLGVMQLQTVPTGGFTAANVNCGLAAGDSACVFGAAGLTSDLPPRSNVVIGRLVQAPAGQLNLVLQQNKGGPTGSTFSTQTAIFTSFTIQPAGNGSFIAQSGSGNNNVDFVLTTTDTGVFLVETNSVAYGTFLPQTSVALNAPATFNVGTLFAASAGEPNVDGFITPSASAPPPSNPGMFNSPTIVDVSSNICVVNPQFPCLVSEGTFTGNYSIDNTGLGTGTSVQPGPSMFDFYVSDGNQFFLLETDALTLDPVLLQVTNVSQAVVW